MTVSAITYSGRLMPGQRLPAGQNLWSQNKRGLLLFETNGNLSWWAATPDANGNAIQNPPPWNMWQAWITGKGGVSLLMQTDGNLVVLDRNNNPVWSTGTPGHPGGFLIAGDDGQLALADAEGLYWALGTDGWKKPSGTPWYRGKTSVLHDVVSTAEDIGSYATTVVALVPGVGTGVSAALSAGLALAQGKNITDAVKAGIRGAIPGGAIAAAGFDVAVKVASGANVGQATLEEARAQLPPGAAQQAFDVGLAVVTGEKHQQANPAIVAPPGQSAAALAQALAVLKNVKASGGIPPKTLEPPKRVAAAPPAPVRAPPKTLEPPKRVAASAPAGPVTPSAGFYTPYPKSVGVGSFWSSNAWRWFVVYENGVPGTQHGPLWLSDDDANAQAANLLASTQGRDAIGDVVRWDWDGKQWRQASGALGAPPHGHPHGGHGHHPGGGHVPHGGRATRGWGWGNVPWGETEIVTTTQTCRTWGDPVAMSPAMQVSAKVALGASNGQPTTLRSDGVLYLLTLEGGAVVARPCAAMTGSLGACFDMDAVTWGPAVSGMSGAMERAGLAAVHGSKGRPRAVRAPDGTDYLFAIENGVLSARPAVM